MCHKLFKQLYEFLSIFTSLPLVEDHFTNFPCPLSTAFSATATKKADSCRLFFSFLTDLNGGWGVATNELYGLGARLRPFINRLSDL